MTFRLSMLLICAFFAAATLAAGPLGILGKDKKQEDKPAVKSAYQNFHYDKNADWERLKKICVQPVDVSAIASQPDAAMLGEFMKAQFCSEITARAGRTWTLVDTPDSETAVLKLSITRLVPPPQADTQEAASISFAGTLTDQKNGSTIMNFSDTKPYVNSKDVVKTWAGDFAEMSMPDSEKAEEQKTGKLRKVARMLGFHFAIRKFMD
jgi:hypothetical protein